MPARSLDIAGGQIWIDVETVLQSLVDENSLGAGKPFSESFVSLGLAGDRFDHELALSSLEQVVPHAAKAVWDLAAQVLGSLDLGGPLDCQVA